MKSSEDKVLEMLDRILLVLCILVAGDKSMTEAARALKLAGVDNGRIATILNTTTNSVSVLTSGVRRQPKK